MARSFSEIPSVDVGPIDNAYWTGEMSSVLARMAAENGPVYKWRVSQGPETGREAVTLVGPEANRFAMHTHREYFSHDLGWTPLVGEMFGKGLLNMDDPEHSRHRKMWNPAFAGAYMDAYLPVMQDVIRARTATWPGRGQVDLYAESREITFDIAAAALAGFRPGPEVDRIRELFYGLIHGFDDASESFEEFMQRMMTMQGELVITLLGMIAARRAAPAEERPHDVLSVIVHSKDDNGQTLSDAQVLAHLNILLLAGHETTTTLSTWALYLLSTMPEQRSRVMSELNRVLGTPGEEDDIITVEKIRAMKVLDNFVRETGRLYPPVLNVPRGVIKDVEFGGYTIPAGTQVRIALGGCHRLPDIFENPDTFDPDRLAPPREEDKRHPYSLVTFGAGPRVCIGQHFALVETKALVAHVLRNYRLEPLPGQRPVHAGFFNAFIPHGIQAQVSA